MQRVDDQFLMQILRACAEQSPLYPADYATKIGVDRTLLDRALDALRTNGLLVFSDWSKGHGQGYLLTDAGRRAIGQPIRLHEPAAVPAPRTPAAEEHSLGEVLRALQRPSAPYVTRIMLAINVAVFLAGLVYAPSQNVSPGEYLSETGSRAYDKLLRKMGALNTTDVFPPSGSQERPEIERMVACNFLHIGLIHLVVNMWALYNLGPLIETLWGHFRFLILYAVSGLVSAGFVLWQGRFALTAGASGVLFGLFASFVVWFLLHRRHLPEQVTQAWSRNIGINLIMLFAINFMPGVSWEGHLGGAIGGGLAALLLSQMRFQTRPVVSACVLLLALSLPVIPYALAYRAIYHGSP